MAAGAGGAVTQITSRATGVTVNAICGAITTDTGLTRFAVVGSPNSGKTTLFNALTGLHAKTGNYPGVTVARYEGTIRLGEHETVVVEDLPGTYSLDPISPDEQIVVDVLEREGVLDLLVGGHRRQGGEQRELLLEAGVDRKSVV